MSRLFARSSQVLIDLATLSAALWLAFMVRFDWDLPLVMLKRLMFAWPYVVAFQYAALSAFRVPRFSWRYVGLREATRIFAATLVAGASLLAMRFIGAALIPWSGYAVYAILPIGVILIDFGVSFMGVAGVRVMRRMLGEQADSDARRRKGGTVVRTLLVGAGQAGLLVAKEISTRPDLGIQAVGFVDDDPVKQNEELHGLKVLGTTADLAALCARYRATQVLITIANAPGKEIRRIKAACDEAGISAKIIPGVYEIVGGHVNLSRIRSVTIEDLLGREPVKLEMAEIYEKLRGKVVVVTGAGGSIGSELCRQICRFGPAQLLLVERSENSLFQIHRELLDLFPEVADRIVPCVADICDERRIDGIFSAHHPSVVFHAAAHKHVPMMEWNPSEAVKNNVLGTRILADLADSHGVAEFVMISTDKAVNPSSVMGVSKRVAEIYIQALSQRTRTTRFVTVRFGNVLGSAGSVIPTFQEQIARGGPVTVTHPEMRRYFMTIPEACQLVLQAGAMGRGGEIFILDMGEPVRIVDLARDLITLTGLRPGEDIEITFTGVRPGEKLFEELSVAEEAADKTRHPKIFVGRFRPHRLEDLQPQLAELGRVAIGGDGEAVRAQLRHLVPEFVAPVETPPVAAPGEAPAEAPAAPLPALAHAR